MAMTMTGKEMGMGMGIVIGLGDIPQQRLRIGSWDGSVPENIR
jgi:hypothetical protein